MTHEEWAELDALRKAISLSPATVVPEEQERFTELLVRSWNYIYSNEGTVSPTL